MNTTKIESARETMASTFGFDQFRNGQADVIQRLLDGDSVLAVFPTGGGKSMCYQLPALLLEGLTVVVSPLIALMKDQIDQLQSRGVKAVRLDSSLSWDDYRAAMDLIRSGEAKLLYVAPERFFNERFRLSLDNVDISLFAIDEAHCISQWGHNFRPDYLKLALLSRQMNVQRVLALTATATPTVQQDVCRAFDIADDNAICTEFYRPNLHLRSQIVNADSRDGILAESIAASPRGATIVYVTLQKTAVSVAEMLADAGHPARAYHAGMAPETRNEIQEWFMTGDDHIVVATIAFGMGIDKSDIRYVYHYNPPKSIENYAQEIGRAGRDGEVSRCEMLLDPADCITLENFVYGDTPAATSIQKFIDQIENQDDEFFISQIKLGNLCDIKSLVLKTLLTQLELQGYLESTSPRYDSYSFKPNVPSPEILSHFEGERQAFAKQLLASSKKKSTWFYLDVPAAMEKLHCDRARIVKAMDYFAGKGWIELRTTGLVHGYRKRKPIDSPATLAASMASEAIEREKSEIGRIGQVIELACATKCQAAALSEYFGQPLAETCGNCSFCIGEEPCDLPASERQTIPEKVFAQVRELVAQQPAALDSHRSIARMLCGLTSPALTRAKLSRHELFGCCSGIPFADVMQQMKTLELETEPPF